MAKVLERMRGVFKKNPKRRQPSSGAPSKSNNSRDEPGTITKPLSQTDEDDDEGATSIGAYNVQEQTQLRGPAAPPNPRGEGLPAPPNPRDGGPPAPPNPRGGGPPAPPNPRGGGPPAPPNPRGEGPPAPPNPRGGGPPAPPNPRGGGPPAPPNPRGGGPPAPPNPRGGGPPNPSNVPFPNMSSGSTPGLPYNSDLNNNMNPSSNTNNSSAPNPPLQSGLPFLSQIQDPSSQPGLQPIPSLTDNGPPPTNNFSPNTNFNQTTQPPTNASMNSFLRGMNVNQPTSATGPTNQQLFPPGINTQMPSMNIQQQRSSTKRAASFRGPRNDDDNVSRLELDYPIENVLIDANIPSAIAVKINEVVEKDRHGNVYHVNRYTYEPSSQHMSFGNSNNHHVDQHSVGNNHHGGTRHIREIHTDNNNPLYNHISSFQESNHKHRRRSFSDTAVNQYIDKLLHTPGSTIIHAQDYTDIQRILSQHLPNNEILSLQPPTIPFQPNNPMISIESPTNLFQSNNTKFLAPVIYYTAQALPYDPMRNY